MDELESVVLALGQTPLAESAARIRDSDNPGSPSPPEQEERKMKDKQLKAVSKDRFFAKIWDTLNLQKRPSLGLLG